MARSARPLRAVCVSSPFIQPVTPSPVAETESGFPFSISSGRDNSSHGSRPRSRGLPWRNRPTRLRPLPLGGPVHGGFELFTDLRGIDLCIRSRRFSPPRRRGFATARRESQPSTPQHSEAARAPIAAALNEMAARDDALISRRSFVRTIIGIRQTHAGKQPPGRGQCS